MPRHQPHHVVNSNARLRAGTSDKTGAPEINVSGPGVEGKDIYDLDGRLGLVQERDITWTVPVRDIMPDVDLQAINNPINQMGPLHALEVPIVTGNDPVSYRAAVNKRSNFRQAATDDDIAEPQFLGALKIISELPDLFEEWNENDSDRERWLAKFDEGKKKRMEDAWLNIAEADRYELSKKTGSVKREVLIGKRFDPKAAGRIIYAGTDAFNATTGPAQMVCMERLVELLAAHTPDGQKVVVGEIEVMLGYKAQDTTLASFISDSRFPEIVEGDFSANDREQRSRVAHLCDRMFAKVGMNDGYRSLMFELEKYTLVNYDFGLKVELMFQLPTGTTNTTFRNSIYNMVMFAYCCRRQGRVGKALVLGDDLLAALNRRLDLKLWVREVAEFKMVLKAKAPVLNGEATFLSRRIVLTGQRPFMIPQPEKAYFRFNCRANPNMAISDDQYVCAKALSYAFSFRHVHAIRNIFLRRFEMQGSHMGFDVSELGWNVRQFGFTTEDIYNRTIDSPNLIEDADWSEWISDIYPDLDFISFEELFEEMILSREMIIIDNPLAARFYELVA
jgi:hypothetical protein